MKFAMKTAVIISILILAVAAFAGNSANLRIPNDSNINGTKIAAGEYKVTVDGNGPDVKVIFAQDGKVKATVNGTMVEGQTAPEYSAVVTDKSGEGVKITELRLAKMKNTVKF